MEDDRVDQDSSLGSKTSYKALLLLLFLLVIGGVFTYAYSEFSQYQAKEDARSKAIINAVMVSKSSIPGIKMVDAFSILLAASGKYVKIIGWDCKKNVKDDNYDVWLNLTVNDNAEKLHWVVDKENFLHPANDLAQKVSVRQQLTL
jgi:hypothetical protein